MLVGWEIFGGVVFESHELSQRWDQQRALVILRVRYQPERALEFPLGQILEAAVEGEELALVVVKMVPRAVLDLRGSWV